MGSRTSSTTPTRRRLRTVSETAVDIGNTIGHGAFGRVYLGKNKETGLLMAVKEITVPSDFKAAEGQFVKMVNELKVLQMVTHPNIVPYLGHEFVGTTSLRLLIFLSYMPGGTLKSQLAEFGAFSIELVQKYTRGLVDGLAYLHALQPPVVHCDLKTANLLLTSDGDIRISDFGSAHVRRFAGEECESCRRGTLPYMAPEVYTGKEVGCAQDIWSLGCCVLEMCTAERAWHDKDIENVMSAYRIISLSNEVPKAPQNCPTDLFRFLYNCTLVRDPSLRLLAEELQDHAFLIEVEDDDVCEDQPSIFFTLSNSSISSCDSLPSRLECSPRLSQTPFLSALVQQIEQKQANYLDPHALRMAQA